MQYLLILASFLATTPLALALPNSSPYEFSHWEHEDKREPAPTLDHDTPSSDVDIVHFNLTTTSGSFSPTFYPPSIKTIFRLRIGDLTELSKNVPSSRDGKIPYPVTELRIDVDSNEHIQYDKMTCIAFSDYYGKHRVHGPWYASEGVQAVSGRGGKAVDIGSVGCDVERGAA